MPSNFQQLWLKNRPKLDAVFGEQLLILPMVRGEFLGARPDPNRPSFTATGIILVEDINSMSAAVLAGTAEKTDVILGSPEATFIPSQFNLSDRLPPVEGDRLVRITLPGAPSYELVSNPLVDSVGQLSMRLSQVLAGVNYSLDEQKGEFVESGSAGTVG